MTQHPDNVTRGERAGAVLKLHQDLIGEWDDFNVRDLLTDLMHHCDTHEIDFDNELRVGRGNYEEEIENPTP